MTLSLTSIRPIVMMTRGAFASGGIARYGLGGLVNTGAAYLVMLALIAIGAPAFVTNATGFLAGLLVSYGTARYWTFSAYRGPNRPWRYLIGFLTCYALNLALVFASLPHLPEAAAQALGLIAYALAFFVVCRLWVFAKTSD